MRRPTDRPRDSTSGPRIAVVVVRLQEPLDGLVGEIARGDDVRDRGFQGIGHATALGQMNLDEVTISSLKAAKRMERLHYSRTLGPAAPRAGSQCKHRNLAFGNRVPPPVAGTLHPRPSGRRARQTRLRRGSRPMLEAGSGPARSGRSGGRLGSARAARDRIRFPPGAAEAATGRFPPARAWETARRKACPSSLPNGDVCGRPRRNGQSPTGPPRSTRGPRAAAIAEPSSRSSLEASGPRRPPTARPAVPRWLISKS